jgi:hypothetical protein
MPLTKEDLIKVLRTPKFDPFDPFDPIQLVVNTQELMGDLDRVATDSNGFLHLKDLILQQDSNFHKIIFNQSAEVLDQEVLDLLKNLPEEELMDLDEESLTDTTVTAASTEKLLDDKMVAHILGGAWASIQDLEGNSSLNAFKYLKTYLEEHPHESLKAELLILPIEIAFKLNNQNQSIKNIVEIIQQMIVDKLDNLNNSGEDILIIPGGWAGLPADPKHNHNKHTGHAIYYTIRKDPENLGKFIFGVVNTGSGLTDNHKPQLGAGGKMSYASCKELDYLTKEQITNLSMLSSLMAPIILPKRHPEGRVRPEYSADEIYNILRKHLPIDRAVDNTSILITPQRIGNCSWKALMAVVRNYLGNDKYKIFINDLKLNTLKILYNNLLNNPTKYDPHQFLMIKALFYGAQKMAKTLEKRKDLFEAETLTKKTGEIKLLLQQAKDLRDNYLKSHPGKVTDESFFDILTQYNHKDVLVTQKSNKDKELLEKISKQIASPNNNNLLTNSVSVNKIVIPKAYESEAADSVEVVQFLKNLKECIEYATKIKNPEALRAFLTNNVFNCLPIPPVFWDQFDCRSETGIQTMLKCLESLRQLHALYVIKTIHEDKNESAYIALPEHMYNCAKIFQIGKYLTTRYAENSNSLKEAIQPDTFCLPVEFDKIFADEGQALDPFIIIKWKQLKENFNFRKSIFESEDSLVPAKTVHESPEFRLFQYLCNDSLLQEKSLDFFSLLKPQTLEQQTLTEFVEIMQKLNLINIHVVRGLRNYGARIECEWFWLINNQSYAHKTLTKIKKNRNLFGNQKLPEGYLSALNSNKQYYDNKEHAKKLQNEIILDSLKSQEPVEYYNLHLISSAPKIQIALLLDYFESLPLDKQNNPNLLEFFKQIFLFNINSSISQLEQYQLSARVKSFFHKEFIKKDPEDLTNHINRYLCFQRVIHKLHNNINHDFEEDLKITRTKCLAWLNNPADPQIDRGKVAAYGLASFADVQNLASLSQEDLKTIMTFSAYVGIYGFGKDSESYDLLLKKDIYDVRLKFAEYMQTCDQKLKQELLNLSLKNEVTKDLVITKEWQESSPYFFSYDEKNDLIQINLTEGIILVNGMQVVCANIPQDIINCNAYRRLFGTQAIEVLQQENYFVPQEKSLRNLKIFKEGIIYWQPSLSQDSNGKYVFPSTIDDKLLHLIPWQIRASNYFSYAVKITDNSQDYRILIANLDHSKGLQPCFEILSNGQCVKISNDPNKLSLSTQDNNNYENFAKKLGFNANNILKWQNDQGLITKIELPIGDEHGNWLSFERKEEAGVWCWTKDPNYFISSEQMLYGRPSATNFILLENKEGRQKALFTNISETDRKYKQAEPLDLADIYPATGGKPDINGLIIDIKQTPNSQAEFSSDNVLSNLYIVYLKIMQPENEPYEASELLDQLRPLRRYSNEELVMLFRIINSDKEQSKLNLEKQHPDIMVTRMLAIYLVINNMFLYPMSFDEKEKFNKQYPEFEKTLDYKQLASYSQETYNKIHTLPKASGRGKLENFLSTDSLNNYGLITPIPFKPQKDKFNRPRTILPKPIIDPDRTILKENFTLQQLEQDICLEINDLSSITDQHKKARLERKRISGHKYELTIHDAILLYLKQDANLWKKYVGLDHNNPDEQTKIHNIQDKIIKYLLLKVERQQGQQDYNPNYNPIDHPAFLVYEASAGIRLRPLQIEKFKQLLTEDGEQAEKQLEIMMGMGKSKVLSPLLANAKADGKHLSVLVLTDPLYSSGSIDIQKSLNLLGVKVENIELTRQTCSLNKLVLLQIQINNAIKYGIACTARVKDLQTIDSIIEVLLEELYQRQKHNLNNNQFQEEQQEKIQILLDINEKIKQQGLFTLDELDSQLYSRHQLNLPLGKENSIDSCGIEVAAELFLMLLTIQFDNVSVKDLLINNNQTFLSSTDFEQKIKPILAEKIFNQLGLSQDLKLPFMAYIGVTNNQIEANNFYEYLKQQKQVAGNSELADKLAMYKMQLNDGKLQETLSKSSNVQLGRSKLQPELEIVIPYAASNQPKESSKTECSLFKDPWETVNKTLLYYVSTKWADLAQTRKFIKFLRDIIINEDHTDPNIIKFINDIKTIFGAKFIEVLQNNSNQWDTDLTFTFAMEQIETHRSRGNIELIQILFQYLSESVFPEQIKFYPIQVNSSTQDFAAQPYKLNGYSGTRRGEKTWHNRIQVDEHQKSDEAIYAKLRNNSNGCIDDIKTADLAQVMLHLQNKAYKNLTNYSSFIDAGALFKEFSNLKVAQLLLSQLPFPKTAVAFYHEIKPGITKLAVIVKDNLENPIIIEGSDPEQLAKALNCTTKELSEKLFNFYDQAHIIGSDLPNSPQGRAFITFSEQLGKDLMNQGIMRMRKFLEDRAQHVDFLVPEKVKEIILKNLNSELKSNETLSLDHLIQHAILIQTNQEKQDYYDALNQKLKHEIKNHLIVKIRELLKQSNNAKALELYGKVRNLILSIEEQDLFYKYGQVSAQTTPIKALENKVDGLKQQLQNLSENIVDLELDLLNKNLDNIITNIDPNNLPGTVASNDLSSGEMEVSAELQQELQQEKELYLSLTPAQNLTLGIPLDFALTVPLKSMLSEKIAKENVLDIQSKLKAYEKFIDNIYYSNDASNTFNEILPVDELFSIYAKPIHQILIVKEPDHSLKVIVLSAKEAAIFTEAIAQNKQLQEGHKMWLVSPNGEALEGYEGWSNPFEQNSDETKSLRELLLQALVLQGNVTCLKSLLTNESCLEWFNNHKTDLHNIFGKQFNIDVLLKKRKFISIDNNTENNKSKKTKLSDPVVFSLGEKRLSSEIDNKTDLEENQRSPKTRKI